MHTHRFPQPLWNATERTITFDSQLSDQVGAKYCDPGSIIYVPNEIVYRKVTNDGRSQEWSTKALYSEYPKALHGPDFQSVTVRNIEEEEAALANGWSLRPQIEEVPLELPVSPFRAPKPVKRIIIERDGETVVDHEIHVRRGPGRPKSS